MSAIIKRYLPRFTFFTLCLSSLGMAVYLTHFLNRGLAQSSENLAVLVESIDIGTVGKLGGFDLAVEGGWTVRSSGRTLGGAEDSAHFVYQSWKGDGEFVVPLHGLSASTGPARGGLMIRHSLDADAIQASIGVTAGGEIDFARRQSSGGGVVDDGQANVHAHTFEDHLVYQRKAPLGGDRSLEGLPQGALPRWLRMVRAGNVVSAYHSPNGLDWEWLGTESLRLDEWIYVGLVVTSGDPATEVTARFGPADFLVRHHEIPLAEPLVPTPGGDGLQARYYADRTFNELLVSRVDGTVAFDWGLDAAVEGGPRDGFSVRWEGLLEAQHSGPHFLHLIADDHASLWLDGRLLIDDWFEHPASESAARVELEAGKKYHLRVDYTEARAEAAVYLAWSSPSTPWSIIPQRQLHSSLVDTDEDQIPDQWERAFGITPGKALDKALQDAIEATAPEGSGRGGKPQVDEILLENFIQGRFPGSQAGTPQPVGRSKDWLSLDLSPNGSSGSTESIDGIKSQRLTSPTARYRLVQGQHPWVLRDDFRFSYRRRNSDRELVAQVVDIEDAHPDALAGVMVRVSTAPDSAYVGVVVSPSRESWLINRRAAGQPATMQRLGSDAHWVRAIRQDNGVSLYESTDGSSWRWLATELFPDVKEALFGLCQQGGDLVQPSGVTFAEVSLKNPKGKGRSEPPIVGEGDGLKGHYSDGARQFERIDPNIDFYWGPGEAPAEGFRADEFTVAWEGELQAQFSEPYCLELACDDGARLWLDGLLLIEDWHDSGAFARSVRLELEAGRRYPIRIEYYEARDEASARLSWSSPSTPKVPIPQSQLYSTSSGESFSLVGRGLGLLRPRNPDSKPGKTKEPMGPPDPDASETRIELVQEIDVTRFQNPTGKWDVDTEAGGVISGSRRGGLEYPFHLAEPGMFLLEIVTEEGNPYPDHNHRLWLGIDGQHLSRRWVTAENSMVARQLTPWLAAGDHRLEIFWDNALLGRSIRIRQISLKAIEGPDKDRSGVADWIEEELARSNGLDRVSKSQVSPAFVEGSAVYWALATARAAGQEIPVHPGAGERWYANIPLSPDERTMLDLSFENGGLLKQEEIKWEVTDLSKSKDLVIRQGDALLFTVGKGGRKDEKSFVVEGDQPVIIEDGEAVPHRFDQPGQFAVTARWGRNDENTVQVTVVGAVRIEPPAALVGQWRPWLVPPLEPDVVIEADPRIDVNRLAVNGETKFRLRTWEPITRHLVFRVGRDGPILQHLPVDGFRLDMGRATGLARVIEQYESGALLVETDTVIMPLRPGVSLRSNMATSGILFSSGHLMRQYPDAHFDELGVLVKQFYVGAKAPRTVSVNVDTYHNGQRVNEF